MPQPDLRQLTEVNFHNSCKELRWPWLDKRIRETDDRLIHQSPLWHSREELLRSVPGVGPMLARTLLVDVPELGQVQHKALASLLGVAPHSRDSGRHLGKRSIAGGRAPSVSTLGEAG